MRMRSLKGRTGAGDGQLLLLCGHLQSCSLWQSCSRTPYLSLDGEGTLWNPWARGVDCAAQGFLGDGHQPVSAGLVE